MPRPVKLTPTRARSVDPETFRRALGAEIDTTRRPARGISPSGRHRSPESPQRETPIVRSILAAFKLRRVWAIRANAGTLIIPETARAARRVVRGAPKGTPDVIGALPEWIWGKRRALFFAIEVKRPGERLRPSQIAWKEQAEQHGVLHGVATSAKEALELHDRWVRELENDRKGAG